jgi:hypothetical protein
VNGKENSSVLDGAFVPLGFVLGESHADEGSDESADCTADAYAGERCHDGTCGDEGADAGDSESADAREEAECSSDDAAGGGPGGCAFGRLGALFMSEGATTFVIRKKDGNG